MSTTVTFIVDKSLSVWRGGISVCCLCTYAVSGGIHVCSTDILQIDVGLCRKLLASYVAIVFQNLKQ